MTDTTRPYAAGKPVVTLFEAYGAGAAEIGQRVADELGVPWIGQAHSSTELEAADPKGSGKVDLTAFYNALAWTDTSSVHLVEDPAVARAREQNAAVRELMKDGGVILGRNATIILADVPGSLHVKLDAPLDDRLDYAMKNESIPRDVAAKRQVREDRTRAEMSLMLWHWDPRLTANYDLMLNTASFGVERCVEIVVKCSREMMAKAGY
ncbi:MAG: cytidylate kinase-like family protein [Dermatophilus congolensis]|nr:cytidylate kinase-like family protein [Dermatophilus congolensis]